MFGARALGAAHRVTRHESGHALDGRPSPDVADHRLFTLAASGHDRVGVAASASATLAGTAPIGDRHDDEVRVGDRGLEEGAA